MVKKNMNVDIITNFTEILSDGTILQTIYDVVSNGKRIMCVQISRASADACFNVDKIDVLSNDASILEAGVNKLNEYLICNDLCQAVN